MIRKFVFMRKDWERISGGSSVARTACTAFVIFVLSAITANAQSGPAITGFLVNGVASNIGPVGATLTIQGSGFGASIGFSTATLNGIAVAGAGVKPVSWTATSIVAVIPQTASSGPVIVTVSEKASNAVNFAIGPVITGISSTSGLPGTGVTISGQGFGTAGGSVAFNGMAASTSGWTDASILATVPTNATEGPIVVTVSGQASNGITFTPTPSISGLSTYSGVGGTVVTISGNSFGPSQVSGSTVTFDGTSASAISSWTNNSITATAPSGGTTGNVVVTVNSVPSAGVMFTYVPSITSLSPIPVLADGIITIGGTNFGAPLATDVVTFDGISATINSWNNTSITAVVPGNVSAGVAVVSVNGVASNAFSFSLTSPYNFSVSYAPDGDVLAVNDNVNGNWVYAYDNFNRLSCSNLSSNGSCASPTSGIPTYTYAYDQYGNRWQQNGPYTMLLTFSNTNNQMDGYSYDAAGNLLNDGNHAYTYDAENRIIQVDQGQTAAYAYDGDGQRIQKSVAGAVLAQYLHDLAGNTITELNASGVWDRSEIYAGAHHLATYGGGASGTTYFVQQDWLGTERARVLPNGDLSETCVSLPFGDGQTCTGSADPSPNHFTGKQRDTESGLDYFDARYLSSSMGRFMTPDWAAKPITVPYAHFGNPQSLNLYGYVQNNPTTVGDPDGHCSSPKVGNGQVGVCIDLYIQAKTINVVGQGDNRGPAANDPKATYRTELQLVADPKKGTVSVVKDDAGVSKALGGLVSNKGTSTTSPITPTTDDNGTTHFTVNNTAMNGLHDLPGAPKDSIKTTINMDVTSEGKVGIEGGMRTAYPSLEIYSYDSSGKATTILQMQEHNPSDLARQDQPIPQVAPQ